MRWFFFLLLLLPNLLFAQDLFKAMEALRAEKKEALFELQQTKKRVAKERQGLRAEIERLKRELKALKEKVRTEERRFEELQAKRDRVLRAQQEVQQEAKALEGIIRGFAKDLKAYFDQSLTIGEAKGREEVLGRALDKGRFPGIEDLKGLVETVLQEIELSRDTVLVEKEFLSSKGELLKGRVLRVGEVAAYWIEGSKVQPLMASGGKLRALGGRLPWNVRQTVRRFVKGEGRDLYVDPSYGAAFAFQMERPGLYEHLKSGGPIVIPIVLIGLFALGIILERIIFFRKLKISKEWRERVIKLAGDQDWDGLREVLGQSRGHPCGRVLLRLLEAKGQKREVLEAVLDEAILREGMALERFLPTLKVLGSVAPLLGLLGTVVGIISTFRAITLFGTGNPRLMAGGISEALVTTEVGLVVAIPVMFLYSYFSSRAERLSVEIEEMGLILIRFMEEEGGGNS
ncbi:MAG: hypothetical protein DRG31_05470 [Deltaproteobacteria bacterium]|nr:MAG: hypothetical protein DRG31_05470 [Deltaproteobacteria bacterium]